MSEKQNQQELKALLKKYLNNEATIAEGEAVNSWYNALGSKEQELEIDHRSKSKLRKSIRSYLLKETGAEKKSWFETAAIKYAAAGLLVIAAGLYGYHEKVQKNSRAADIVISSALGTQKQLTLPDGSQVLLNQQSTITISKDFGEDFRKVSLVGEAFFKVAKNKAKPFIITSGLLKTRVLGTSFNINAYPEMERIKISVMTGRVKVIKCEITEEKILAHGLIKDQTISFYKKENAYEIKTEPTVLIASWRDKKLYIDNATIEDIANQLARYYHVKVVNRHITNPKDKYTIRFNNESMAGVLQILSVLTKRHFTYSNHQIIIN